VPNRTRLPDERQAVTHKFSIAGHKGYLTVGLYENGQPGELFISMAKEGSTVSGMMASFAIAVSMALQYGVPLKVLCEKFSHSRFEPSGYTTNANIRYAKSITDYIFRWLALRFLPQDQQPVKPQAEEPVVVEPMPTQEGLAGVVASDSPSCSECGSIMVRSGACYKCMNCGGTSGCS